MEEKRNWMVVFPMRGTTLVAVLALMLGMVGQANAWEIFADTTGPDSYTTPEFYGIQFLSGSPEQFVQSVTYDISVVGGAFFDFDGDASYGNQDEPVLGTLVGLTDADITFDLLDSYENNPLHVRELRFNFAVGSFGAGDSMRFAADTDFFVSDPTPGNAFGQAGAQISATMFDGTFGSATFAAVSSSRSEATITPEPATLLMLGLGGLGLLRRRKSA